MRALLRRRVVALVGVPGSPRLRWGLAAGAVVLGITTGITSVALTIDEWQRLGTMLVTGGTLLLVAAVMGRGGALPWGVACLAGAAGLTLAGRSREVVAITLLAAALVAVTELAGWSLDRRAAVPEPAATTGRRTATLVLVLVGTAVLSLAVLTVGRLPAPGGALPFLVGLVAALALVTMLTARRWDS